MAQSNADLAYRDFDVFWAGPSLEPPVSWEEFIQSFQLIVVAKEEIDIEDLLQDNPNNCPTILVRLWKRGLTGKNGSGGEKCSGNNTMV